jgi:hypothetical protein
LTVVPSNCLATTHPDLAAQWHPTKNGSVTPYDVVAGCNTKFWWKCYDGRWPDGTVADDHEWETGVNHRTTPILKTGCPCCVGKKVVPSNCLATTHPEVAAQWQTNRNGSLTPHDVVAGSDRRVWWKCPKVADHEWFVGIDQSTGPKTSYGCPRCGLSKGETAVAGYLSQRTIPHLLEWGQGRGGLPRRLRFDFAVNRNGQFWLIEYHGEQHYRPVDFGSKRKTPTRQFVDAIRRDDVKEKWCRTRKKNLLVIPYWDFERIDAILDDFFGGKEPSITAPPEKVVRYELMKERMRRRIRKWSKSPPAYVKAV